MSAETRLRLSSLFVSAFELSERRSPEMVDLLLQCMQQFKENTLTVVQSDQHSSLMTVLRDKTRERFARGEGEAILLDIESQFPTRAKNALKNGYVRTFADLLIHGGITTSKGATVFSMRPSISHRDFRDFPQMGKKTAEIVTNVLAVHGLYYMMSEEHLKGFPREILRSVGTY